MKITTRRQTNFLYFVMSLQYYEMSYGLNVEMHKQVSSSRSQINHNNIEIEHNAK